MSEILGLAGPLVPLPGYLPGHRQPALLATLSLAAEEDVLVELSDRLDAVMRAALPAAALAAADGPPDLVLMVRILHWIQAIQRAADLPVFEDARIHGLVRRRPLVCRVTLPVADQTHGAAVRALTWMRHAVQVLGAGEAAAPVLARLPRVIQEMRSCPAGGSNTLRFLRAAYALDIPCGVVAGRVYQFGQGARARWLDSSFSDATPAIASLLTRDKRLTATVLRRAGLPVPPHLPAPDAEAAVAAAERLGYPVVVKPANLDGGIGVAAGLRTAAAVRKAYAAARRQANAVLVEKHVDGRDYRLVVFQGALIWAIERIPGGVVGDGRHCVQALVDRANDDPRRGTSPQSPLHRLSLDEEAVELLGEAGLSPADVPGAGQFVRLRRTANIASGGEPVAVFDRIHPDNRSLAERAAVALRLDIAGIDLLIPDIARSWHETGAAICEVNGQPNLGRTTVSAHLYGQILRGLVSGDGRIPIAVVVGDTPEGNVAARIGHALMAAGRTPGWMTAEGAWVNGRPAAFPDTVFAGGRLLLADPTVDAAVLDIPDISALGPGLPFDAFDLLVIAGEGAGSASAADMTLVRALLPACTGPIVHKGVIPPLAMVASDRLRTAEALPEAACTLLLAADARHRAAPEARSPDPANPPSCSEGHK